MSLETETRERLSREDADYRRLARKHREYEDRLEALRARRHLNVEEQFEENRLKKLKLSVKDRMEMIVRGALSRN